MPGRWGRLPRERASGPLVGYKLAHPMLSSDGTRIGFAGVLLGSSQVYGPMATARCVQVPRHRCPKRLCDCGFYCLNSIHDAYALACDSRHRFAVLLEITASGRYIRFERGLRYSHQRVHRVRVGWCRCASPARLLADTGDGQLGWRRLVPSCSTCAGNRPALTFDSFARLADARLAVTADPAPPAWTDAVPQSASDPAAGADSVPLLHAEVALLQARLDDLQRRLAELTPPPGS